MKHFTILFIAAIMLMLTSCGPSAADLEALRRANKLTPTNYQSFEEAITYGGYSSDIDYVNVNNHEWVMTSIYSNRISTVFIHSPDCKLCKELHKQELDSLYLKIKDLIEKK